MAESKERAPIAASRRVALIAVMAALALVGNYALVGVPNVELGSTILFFTGYAFGLEIAIPSALLMSLIYGTINPWGMFIPQIWLSQVIGWSYMVVAGNLLRRDDSDSDPVSAGVLFITGAISTLVFDLVTSIGYSIAFSIPFVIALAGGVPFMIVHVTSNAILFALAIPRLERSVIHQFASQIWQREGTLELESEE